MVIALTRGAEMAATACHGQIQVLPWHKRIIAQKTGADVRFTARLRTGYGSLIGNRGRDCAPCGDNAIRAAEPPSRGGGPSRRIHAASAGRPPRLARPRAARRSPVRSGRALAAVALLALSCALALPATAEAQTVTTTLVSNIDQAAATANRTDGLSQAFTTGSHASGYVLTGVEIASASTTAFTARVCGTNTSGEPTLPCTDLTAPGSIAVGGNSFTAPADTHLTSATTYAVVVTGEYDEGLSFGRTEADGEDAGHATGWSIADFAFHGAVSIWTFTGSTPN